MILKKLQTGATTVIVTKKEYDEYISQGYTYVEDVEVAMDIEEAEEENVRFKLDGTNLYWKYESDFNWTLFTGGSAASTSKVKVNASDSTEQYLSDKLVADTGTEISVVDTGGVKTLKFKSKANIPAYNVANAYKLGDTVGYTDSKEYRANADIPENTAWAIGTTGATWKLVGGSSGGSGVTVYADLTAIKAVDTTSYTTTQTVQVTSLGLYKFQPASTLTGDDVNVITPAAGSSAGRWILQSTITAKSDTTASQTWSETNRPLQKIGDRVVKTTPTVLGKKIVCIGSSVMLGYGLTTPTTQSYPALQLAENNTEDTGWTLKNFSITGETSASAFIRLLNDIQAENPDIVWLGYSPNNNGLATKTTDADCATAIYDFERNVDRITRALDQQGIPYVISGLYPKGDFTALAYKYLKQCNINLQLKYGLRYINFLGSLDDGTGKFKTSLVQADLTHPNAVGADIIQSCIPYRMFIYNRYNTLRDIPKFSDKNGIILGSDTTTATPLLVSDIARSKCFTIQFEVYNDDNLTANKVLLSVNYSTKTLDVIKNSSGYIDLLYNGATTLTVASTTQFRKGFNVIQLTYDATGGLFELWLNGVKVGTSAAITSFYFSYFSIGGNATPANNSTGVEFRNVAKWCNKMTDDELVALANGTMLPGSLEYFNPLSSIPNGYYANEGGATIKARLTVLSSSWTKSTRGSLTVTTAEKEKLATINTVGTAVASTTTITAPSTVFHVTGTTAISTINLPYTGFTGKITIIPDGIFTFATGGNIYETYTATVGRAIELVYDGTAWYRSNS